MLNQARHVLVRCAALFGALLAVHGADAASVRFYGAGVNDIDRIKIRIDAPSVPADVGATDFTIEFWLRSADNPAASISCGANINWINGNIVFDRDRFNQGRSFGISLAAGRVAFGTRTNADGRRTICGSSDIRDGAWHHVAVQRAFATGLMTIYVDGQPDGSGTMSANENLSYPDNATPGNFCGSERDQSCADSDPFIVLGAEKHDAGTEYPSFDGWLDELRISTSLRYSGPFTPAQQPFLDDARTAALYHFDETSGWDVVDARSNGSPGVLSVGGSPPGPEWSTETPFSATPAAGTLQLGAATYAQAENAPSVTLTATRTGGSSGAVTVNFATAPGTATPGSDYTMTMSTVSWNDNDAAPKNIVIPLVDDSVFEGAETFTVALDANSVAGGAKLGSRTSATVTVTDNEMPPAAGVLELTSGTYSAGESAGTATIAARRVSGADGIVGISYATADGTATAGTDYQSASSTLSWSNGELGDKSFTVTLLNDTNIESTETVTVTLSNPTGGAALGTPLTAQLSIGDDDAPSGGSGGGGGGGGGGGATGIAEVLLWLLVLGLSRLAPATNFGRRPLGHNYP